MTKRRVLVSWIGHADLLAMGDDLGEAGRELLAAAHVSGKYGDKPGPVKTAVSSGQFDEVHLLSNYPEVIHKPFSKWLGGKPSIHRVELKDPTDYLKVFEVADQVLQAVVSSPGHKDNHQLGILLSPGTPTMAVVWVLLGSSRYPATFYQTFKGTLRQAPMPTDLFDVIVPDLVRDRDVAFQALAAQSPQQVAGFEEIIGDSQALRIAVGRARRAALRDVPVLIVGESGTGKEMFASAIHKSSHRSTGPFCSINCAAIPRDLLEAELFGHTKGAFTGADREKKGLFSQADGGTLFLDEIGECDPLLQVKLLRVLQPPPNHGPAYRVFRPVGAQVDSSSDVRIVAATNRNLQREIEATRFREDLYYRLAVITLQLPPVRERRSDLPLLVEQFLSRINEDFAAQDKSYENKRISASTMEFVKKYAWPGNVRQLYNTLLQAAVMTDGPIIDRRDLTAAVCEMQDARSVNILEQNLGDGFNLEEHLNSIQSHYLRRAMAEAQGNKTRAARLLGLKSYQALDAQLDRLQVRWE